MKPYYDAPDNLKHLVTLTNPDACYDFSDVILVKDTNDGKLYAAHDSGCSCPSPFEKHVFPTDFTEIRSTEDFRNFLAGVLYTHYDQPDINAAMSIVEVNTVTIRPMGA